MATDKFVRMARVAARDGLSQNEIMERFDVSRGQAQRVLRCVRGKEPLTLTVKDEIPVTLSPSGWAL